MDFFQGENTNLYLTVTGDSGPILTGVSGVTVDVYHFIGSTLVQDVVSGSMTNQAAPFNNVWYYNYNVPSGAALTSYNVVYNAFISGTSFQTSETFSVFPAATVAVPVLFSGSVAVSGTVVDPSGVGIANAAVQFASGTFVVGSTTTNPSGNYSIYLNPMDYYALFTASGYFTNQLFLTVPSGASANLGLTTLVPDNIGSLTISDTLVTLDPYGNPIPLSNIKVQLWSIDSVGGGSAIGTTFTNVSGTFFLTANPGNYILSMAGMDTNYNRYNQTRNIEVNSVYNFPPTGPVNFQYGDTSSYNFL
jgi:hypothetical protein